MSKQTPWTAYVLALPVKAFVQEEVEKTSFHVKGFHGATPFERVYACGDRCCYGGESFYFLGTIVSFTKKTVIVRRMNDKLIRLSWDKFVTLNVKSVEDLEALNDRTNVDFWKLRCVV